MSFPASLVSRLGAETQGHRELEAEYGVVVRYPKETQAVIIGNAVQVTLAASKLEDLKLNLAKIVKDNQALKDFALKLGYEQDEVTAVFEKLGSKIDRNTLLNELINFSKQKSQTPIPLHTTLLPRSIVYSRDMYGRHPSEMVTSKGLPTGGMNHGTGIGAMGYRQHENPNVVARGCVRTTAQTSQSNVPTTTYAMSPDYGNVHHNNFPAPFANDPNQMVGPDHRQEEQMFQELLTDNLRSTSDLRHIVIDGSNVAMRYI